MANYAATVANRKKNLVHLVWQDASVGANEIFYKMGAGIFDLSTIDLSNKPQFSDFPSNDVSEDKQKMT